jgi:hypothetical protein
MHAAHGGEKLEIIFPAEDEMAVSKAMGYSKRYRLVNLLALRLQWFESTPAHGS